MKKILMILGCLLVLLPGVYAATSNEATATVVLDFDTADYLEVNFATSEPVFDTTKNLFAQTPAKLEGEYALEFNDDLSTDNIQGVGTLWLYWQIVNSDANNVTISLYENSAMGTEADTDGKSYWLNWQTTVGEGKRSAFDTTTASTYTSPVTIYPTTDASVLNGKTDASAEIVLGGTDQALSGNAQLYDTNGPASVGSYTYGEAAGANVVYTHNNGNKLNKDHGYFKLEIETQNLIGATAGTKYSANLVAEIVSL